MGCYLEGAAYVIDAQGRCLLSTQEAYLGRPARGNPYRS
jgi:hypothetical protein